MTIESIKKEHIAEIEKLAAELMRKFITKGWINYYYCEGKFDNHPVPGEKDAASFILYRISTDIGSKVGTMVPRDEFSSEDAHQVEDWLRMIYDKCTIIERKDGRGWNVELQNIRFQLYQPDDIDKTCGAFTEGGHACEFNFDARSCAFLIAAVDYLIPSAMEEISERIRRSLAKDRIKEIVAVSAEGILKESLTKWGYGNFDIAKNDEAVILCVHLPNGMVMRVEILYERFHEFMGVLHPLLDRISSPDETFEDISFLEGLPLGECDD